MTFTYSQSFMLDCVTNKCERDLDCEFESKRNRPAFGEKKAKSDLAAEKYVTWYLTSVLSQTFY